jgi:hypothetical protein
MSGPSSKLTECTNGVILGGGGSAMLIIQVQSILPSKYLTGQARSQMSAKSRQTARQCLCLLIPLVLRTRLQVAAWSRSWLDIVVATACFLCCASHTSSLTMMMLFFRAFMSVIFFLFALNLPCKLVTMADALLGMTSFDWLLLFLDLLITSPFL